MAPKPRPELTVVRTWPEDLVESEAATEAWAKVLDHMAELLPVHTFLMWIRPVECVGVVDNELFVDAPEVVHSWVERRYLKMFNEATRDLTEFEGVRFS